MNKSAKRRWLAALRSGKYRRGKGQLRKGRNFCCLGVLCEVMKAEYDPVDGELPPEVIAMTDFPDHMQAHLASLNDGDWCDPDTRKFGDPPKGYKSGEGAPFRVIADWIEKHL